MKHMISKQINKSKFNKQWQSEGVHNLITWPSTHNLPAIGLVAFCPAQLCPLKNEALMKSLVSSKALGVYQHESRISAPSLTYGRSELSLFILSMTSKNASILWIPYCSHIPPHFCVPFCREFRVRCYQRLASRHCCSISSRQVKENTTAKNAKQSVPACYVDN